MGMHNQSGGLGTFGLNRLEESNVNARGLFFKNFLRINRGCRDEEMRATIPARRSRRYRGQASRMCCRVSRTSHRGQVLGSAGKYFWRYSPMGAWASTVRVRRYVRVMLSPATARMGPFLAHVRVSRRRAGKNLVPRAGILRQSSIARLVIRTRA